MLALVVVDWELAEVTIEDEFQQTQRFQLVWCQFSVGQHLGCQVLSSAMAWATVDTGSTQFCERQK